MSGFVIATLFVWVNEFSEDIYINCQTTTLVSVLPTYFPQDVWMPVIFLTHSQVGFDNHSRAATCQQPAVFLSSGKLLIQCLRGESNWQCVDTCVYWFWHLTLTKGIISFTRWSLRIGSKSDGIRELWVWPSIFWLWFFLSTVKPTVCLMFFCMYQAFA